MKHTQIALVLALALLAACASPQPAAENAAAEPTSAPATEVPPEPTEPPAPTATATPPPPTLTFNFTQVTSEDDPSLVRPRGWEGGYTWSPYVVYHDGLFHMFYNGSASPPLSIGYATSEDGIHFEKYEANPVYTSEAGGSASRPGVIGPVVYVQEDGTWVMLLVEQTPNVRRLAGHSIVRVTAETPTGPWSPNPRPLYSTAENDWDHQMVVRSLLSVEDGFLLAYDARPEDTVNIGTAFSEDGLSYANPAGAPGLERGPEGSWEQYGVGSPVVFQTEEGYEMFYIGFHHNNRRLYGWDNGVWLGYATSTDGIHWEKYPNNPVVVIEGEVGFPYLAGIKVGETYYIYFAYRAGAGGIGLITGTITPID